jgi:hypothetical protein
MNKNATFSNGSRNSLSSFRAAQIEARDNDADAPSFRRAGSMDRMVRSASVSPNGQDSSCRTTSSKSDIRKLLAILDDALSLLDIDQDKDWGSFVAIVAFRWRLAPSVRSHYNGVPSYRSPTTHTTINSSLSSPYSPMNIFRFFSLKWMDVCKYRYSTTTIWLSKSPRRCDHTTYYQRRLCYSMILSRPSKMPSLDIS